MKNTRNEFDDQIKKLTQEISKLEDKLAASNMNTYLDAFSTLSSMVSIFSTMPYTQTTSDNIHHRKSSKTLIKQLGEKRRKLNEVRQQKRRQNLENQNQLTVNSILSTTPSAAAVSINDDPNDTCDDELFIQMKNFANAG